MQRFVIIDGHAILHRAFHAIPPLTTSKGELVNAVFGFVSMFLRVVADIKPTHLVVTFDLPAPTFRKKLFKEYQAHRPRMDDELSSQISTVIRVLTEMGVSIYTKEGYEADDVIGTIVEKVKSQKSTPIQSGSKVKSASEKSKIDTEVVIVTGDRDILQLVDDKTKVYMPVKGLSESKLYGEKEVEDKFGIKPKQIVDYKALVGDSSDNYPGVAGVGPKTAAALISRYGTLDEIYNHLDQVENEGLKKKLADNKESALTSKQLATIVTDVPIELDAVRCELPNFDRPHVHKLFEDLEFRSLIPRLSGKSRQTENTNKPKKEKDNNIQQAKLF